MDLEILKKLNFSDKSANVYLALLRLGPSSVRKLANFCDLNRGTVYDVLKDLQEKKVVSFYKKDTKQCFVAEDPEKLFTILQNKKQDIEKTGRQLDNFILELQAIHNSGDKRPVAKYFDKNNLQKILEDVLDTCQADDNDEKKEYRIYSAEGVRPFLYESFPTFSDVRIARNIFVKVIAIGEGGELRGLDERKWLKKENSIEIEKDTFIIIYPGKTAYISMGGDGEPVGVVIENRGVYNTQKLIFDNLWKKI